MSEYVRSLTVILDEEIRVDDVKGLANAIRHMRHVSEVKLGPVMDVNQYVAEMDAKRKVAEAVHDALYGDKG